MKVQRQWEGKGHGEGRRDSGRREIEGRKRGGKGMMRGDDRGGTVGRGSDGGRGGRGGQWEGYVKGIKRQNVISPSPALCRSRGTLMLQSSCHTRT